MTISFIDEEMKKQQKVIKELIQLKFMETFPSVVQLFRLN